MKANLPQVYKFISSNLIYLWFAFMFGFIIFSASKVQEEHKIELKKKDNEIVELRSKINNHLIAEGFYSKPAKDVLPVMKEFGIEL